jgi:hypothetical protein
MPRDYIYDQGFFQERTRLADVAFRGQTEQQLRTYLADMVGLVGGPEQVSAAPCERVGHS